jgi:hypothetical protein
MHEKNELRGRTQKRNREKPPSLRAELAGLRRRVQELTRRIDVLATIRNVQRPRELRGWRTIKELREELRFSSDKACRSWLHREGIACVRRGRVILVSSLDIDRALRSA